MRCTSRFSAGTTDPEPQALPSPCQQTSANPAEMGKVKGETNAVLPFQLPRIYPASRCWSVFSEVPEGCGWCWGSRRNSWVFFPVCCLLWFGFNPLVGGEQRERLRRVWKLPAWASVRCQMHAHSWTAARGSITCVLCAQKMSLLLWNWKMLISSP